jgi:hypothetical protein
MVLELGKEIKFNLRDKTIGEIIDSENKLGKDIINATLGIEGLIKNKGNLVEKQVVLSWIEKFKATRFANLLVSAYVNEDDVHTKNMIERTLSKWLANGDIRRLPKKLIDGINRRNKKKKEYIKLLVSLAPSSPSAFATALFEIATKKNIEKEYLAYLYDNLKKTIETKKDEEIVIRQNINSCLHSIKDELITAKLNLEDETDYTDNNSSKIERSQLAYIKAMIFSDLLQFVELKEKDKTLFFFLTDTLLEMGYLKPAVTAILNVRLKDDEKIEHIRRLYVYLDDLKKTDVVSRDFITELEQMINSFLKEQNIVLFIPKNFRRDTNGLF